jgi:hypothetical protein
MLAREARDAADAAARRHVADFQRRARGWFVVMYSPYWECYIAYYLGECGEGGLTLRAPDPGRLWVLMDYVAPAGWQMDDIPVVSARRPAPVREGAGQ